MNPYKRFTLEKRRDLALMLVFNPHQYRIAEHIGCTQSAISQEISRNSTFKGYDANKAQEAAESRRRNYAKPVLGDKEKLSFIEEELKKRRSPVQISELADRKDMEISKSSIYNYIKANPRLKKYLKHKKYRKRNRNISSKHGIPDRVSISERPEAANTREEFGHLEKDFVIGSDSTDCILSARERKTRYPFLIKLENKTELLTTEAVKQNLALAWVKSFSTDNDKSFVGHAVIKSMTGIQTYFTRPAAPYEKGAIEHLNKELRVYYPKGTNFKNVSQADLDVIVNNLRTAPMKVLGWRTPQEAFEAELALNAT